MGIAHKHLRTAPLAASLALTLSLVVAGCKSAAPNDATLTTQVQGRIASDPNLSGQSVQANVANGVVTLSGTVGNDTQRNIAGGDAAQVAGVRTVVNNLEVQPAVAAVAPQPAPVVAPAPEPVRPEHKPSPAVSRTRPEPLPPPQSAPIVRNTPPPAPIEQAQAPAPPPPPPPPPAPRKISIPAGTTLPVRITQTLDSATTQQGDKFTGSIASDVVVEGAVVLPQGTPVTGRVDAVQDATHFKGSSLLTVSLNAINRKGDHIEIATDSYTKQGEGRGKNTAEKVGGGAAVGAILGGIFGGGKGAAIGSVAGGGLGAGAQAVTRGQQVQIPSESILRFRLNNPVIVQVSGGGASQDSGASSTGLERRPPQQ